MGNLAEIKTELLSVSNQDVEALGSHLATMKQFVSSQLKEGINNDFAKIEGTPKKSLLKPGAEKLCKLFGFSSRVECIEKIISPEENFAMFTYRCTIIHIKSGAEVAQCEGICNSQEKKYRDKAKYEKGQYVGREPQNAMDLLNTLMKMAQKRAFVGATILATGASDYFTQDEDEIESQKENKNQVVQDDKFKDVTPSGDVSSYVVKVGKHKGRTLEEIGKKDLESYLNWVAKNNDNPSGPLLEALNKGREFLRGA